MIRSMTCGLALIAASLTADAACTPDYRTCGCEAVGWDSNITFMADFLYWKVSSEDYAWFKTINMQAIQPGSTNGLVEISRTYQLDPGWKPGVRLRAQTPVDCCSWDLYGQWTWYRNTTKRKAVIPTPDGAVSLFTQLLFPRSPLMGGGSLIFFNNIVDSEVDVLEPVRAEHVFGYNRLEIGVTKAYTIRPGMTLIPYGSFTYLHTFSNLDIFTRMNALYANTEISFGDGVGLQPIRQLYRVSHDGVGIDIGINTLWQCSSCFEIMAGGGITGLFDRRKARFSTRNQAYLSTAFDLPLFDLDFAEADRLPFFRHDCNESWMGLVIPHITIGISYEGCSCGFEYDLHVGYEHQLLIDSSFFGDTGTASNSFGSTQGGTPALQAKNVHLQGINVGVGVSF